MKVKLVSLTPEPIKCMYLGAARCRTCGELEKYAENEPKIMRTVVATCLQSGHLTVAEMAEMTFDVQGVDLNTVMQYLRHRHFSTLQRSGRAVQIGTSEEMKALCDASENTDEEQYKVMKEIVDKYFLVPEYGVLSTTLAMISYDTALKKGIKLEEARRILPQGMLTDLMVHCNFRALMEASRLRLCFRAQKEIQDLFHAFKSALEEYSDDGAWMASFLQRKCEALGCCNETNSCGYFEAMERSQDGQGEES